MFKIIKNAEIYTPEYIGKKDILICAEKICAIEENISLEYNASEVEIIDGTGMIAAPGFIDSHVHILGGGGEGGFSTRTPEINLTDITTGGVTTVVGCLGTDGVSRSLPALLAKSRALDEEGISTYIYSGSYDIPVKTFTGSPKSDIILIDKVIGIGEVAISDHRSSQPTFDEFLRTVSDARVGGMLSGKAGITNIHLGDGKSRLNYCIRMAKETEIPVTQVIPTHINRSEAVFEAALEFAALGGILDLTTSSDPDHLEEDEIKASTGLKRLLNRNIPIEQIQFTSDGQGSLPIFNECGEFTGLGVGKVTSLHREVKDAILQDNVKLEDAFKTVTSNPARNLKLKNKGHILKNFDADIVLMNSDSLEINTVIAKGNTMISNYQIVKRGTFN